MGVMSISGVLYERNYVRLCHHTGIMSVGDDVLHSRNTVNTLDYISFLLNAIQFICRIYVSVSNLSITVILITSFKRVCPDIQESM